MGIVSSGTMKSSAGSTSLLERTTKAKLTLFCNEKTNGRFGVSGVVLTVEQWVMNTEYFCDPSAFVGLIVGAGNDSLNLSVYGIVIDSGDDSVCIHYADSIRRKHIKHHSGNKTHIKGRKGLIEIGFLGSVTSIFFLSH